MTNNLKIIDEFQPHDMLNLIRKLNAAFSKPTGQTPQQIMFLDEETYKRYLARPEISPWTRVEGPWCPLRLSDD